MSWASPERFKAMDRQARVKEAFIHLELAASFREDAFWQADQGTGTAPEDSEKRAEREWAAAIAEIRALMDESK